VRFHPDPEPITDDDATIRAGVAGVPVAPLLAAVAHLTGDTTILRDELVPDLTMLLDPEGGYTPEQAAAGRELAAAALIRHRDSGSKPAAPPDDVHLRRLVAFVAGGTVDDDYLPLLEEELALDGTDLRAPRWRAAELAPQRELRVGIVGAGMSGIAVAHRLRQAGVPVVIFEKNDDVGGTWLENDYPGCRVDVPNHFYSYSFAQSPDWPQFHSTQPVLLDYFRACVDQFDLRDSIRFGTEVTDARWRDDDQRWDVHTNDADGPAVHEVDVLVSAVGQLNRPLMPDVAGIESFAGPWFHSARWEHDVDLDGKRVAVLGTGCSAVQFLPHVAERAAHLTIYQRTAPWLLPVPVYQDDLPETMRWLLRHVPDFARWDRAFIFARTQEGLLPLATVDPAWEPKDRSVSAANDMLRELLTAYIDSVVPDGELRSQVLPGYPPVAKRVVLDNGVYPAMLQRPDVTLESTGIAAITPAGVRTVDGVDHEHDVLIYGTGFQASKFLTPMRVLGTRGADLHGRWGGDARAYLGLTVPDFPNLFLMYGPNTNIVINGSIIYFSECEANYIVESVRLLLETGLQSMDCRTDVHDAYNERIDAGNRTRAWGCSDVNSWYKNEFGRVAQNWPFNLLDYWKQTRAPVASDYEMR